MSGPTAARAWARARACAAAVVVPALAGTGCMPWVVGQTAETVPPGRVAPGIGIAVVAPPAQPHRPLPVPQAWLAVGVRENLDVGVVYVAPLTFHGRGRLRLLEGPGGAAAVALGAGLHGVPDLAEAGERFWTPFATVDAVASSRREGARPYGAARLIAPVYVAVPAATAWWVLQGGVELEAGRLRWGPEAGVVVPATRPSGAQLILGVSARRIPLP